MANLISVDSAANKIYKHTGISSSITTSFASPDADASGLTFDGTNLISCGYDGNKIYKHTGITSSISTSFASPSTSPRGLTFDGTNLISCDNSADKIYKHTGISSSITTSFASPSGIVSGLTLDGTNLISCDYGAEKIYKHTGISSSITTSFASPGTVPQGLTFDGTNLISCDSTADAIYKHTGISSSITTSFASPSTIVSGLTMDDFLDWADPPTVTTQAATLIQKTSARGNGNITDDGGASITQHGVCWKAGADPVNIAGSDGHTTEGAGSEGAFTSDMTSLSPETSYYYRAYATNSEGTSYGGAQSFTTLRQPRSGFINFQDPGML